MSVAAQGAGLFFYRPPPMKPFFLLPLVLLLGCSHFSIKQTDISTLDENQNEVRTITTDVAGSTWFTSAQALTKLKVTQTDKTQSTGFDHLGQQGATNSLAALEALARIAEAVRPTP